LNIYSRNLLFEFETPLVLLCVLTYLRGLEVAELKEEDMPMV